MENKKITGEINIAAPREKVWHVLLDDASTRAWYAAFGQGSSAKTDWSLGSKAIFTSDDNCGLIGTIASNEPNTLLAVEYTGVMTNGQEEYESKEAQQVKGGREVYRLSGSDGHTTLAIECDMAPEMYDYMHAAWQKALQKIKELAEGCAQ